jgi:hypothetical protein
LVPRQERELYSIRIKGHLGATSLVAFPDMVSQIRGPDSVLTGFLNDQPALFGVLHTIETLALDLIEVRRCTERESS